MVTEGKLREVQPQKSVPILISPVSGVGVTENTGKLKK